MDPFVASFDSLAQAQPSALAVLHGERGLTRADLRDCSHGLGRDLARSGLGAGRVVALVAPPGPGFLAAFLALRRVGASVLLLDPGTTPSEEQRILAALPVDDLWRIELGASLDQLPAPQALGRPKQALPSFADDLAVIKLSSGSSGVPVGIGAGEQHLVADGRQIIASLGMRSSDRILCVIPCSHSYGFSVLATPLFLLGTPLLVPEMGDPWAMAAEHGATVLPSVPAWFRAQLRGRDAEQGWASSLRLFLSAGAPLEPELAAEWRERTGRHIQVLYGSSECGSVSFDRVGGAAERGTVGTPLDGVRVELVGEAGAAHVRVHSPAVVHGYVTGEGGPAVAERSSRIGKGTFDTEDLGEWQAGELRLRGRRSAWINVNGKKVDPVEVEQAIRDLPGVEEVAVLAKPLGDGRGEAVRAVVACPSGSLDYGRVSAWCRGRLAPYKVPRSIVLVPSLPRTARGKLDRKALLALSNPRTR